MRKSMILAAVICLAGSSVSAQDRQIVRMPDGPTVSAERAGSILDAAGVFDPIERRWLVAAIEQESAENESGTLSAGRTMVVPFEIGLATAKAKPESQQWRFAVSYTPTIEIVEGGVFCRDDRGRWSPVVEPVYGGDGKFLLQVGLLALSDDATNCEFLFRDTEYGSGSASKERAVDFRVSVKRSDEGTDDDDDDPEPPDPTAWEWSGAGTTIVDIPDSVARFRIAAEYDGRSSNAIVECGERGDSGLLFNELVGTSWSTTRVSAVVLNLGKYSTRHDLPCGALNVEADAGVQWVLTQLTSR